mgnify:CR=1 FL=1
MKRVFGGGIAVLLPLALLLGIWWSLTRLSPAQARAATQAVVTEEPNQRLRQEAPDAPTISFIDSPTPQCQIVDREKDLCAIRFYYLQVYAADTQYIISMSVRIDNRIRGYFSGFFQDAMYVPGDMFAQGYSVRCGPPGSGGNAYLGKSYTIVIRARETGGLSSSNYATVTCPAGLRVTHLPLVRRN